MLTKVTKYCLLLFVVCANEVFSDTTGETSGRDFGHHLIPEEDKNFPSLTYPPSSYVALREGPPEACAPGALMPMLSNGLSFIMLKLGVFGVIKAIFAVLFIAFVTKLPLLLGKLILLKTIFFPMFLAPLLFLTSNILPSAMNPMDPPSKPNDAGDTAGGVEGRSLADTAYDSLQMVFNSDKCLERMACQFGAESKDGYGSTVNRFLKYAHYSSPSSIREKMAAVKDAFKTGYQHGTCILKEYPCESPTLLLNHGKSSVRIM